jgi:hypothetical protein
MRLLEASTLILDEFFDFNVPPYAILSHTRREGEVTFQDIYDSGAQSKLGYIKIEFACQQALKDGLSYVWIDTCCIDKSSSTGLSEAINFMYSWYRQASVCDAFLSDLPGGHNELGDISTYTVDTFLTSDVTSVNFYANPNHTDTIIDFYLAKSRWFTRGWTL